MVMHAAERHALGGDGGKGEGERKAFLQKLPGEALEDAADVEGDVEEDVEEVEDAEETEAARGAARVTVVSTGPAADSTADYATWVELVERIRAGETDGMADLYRLFSKGIRFYLCRQLGPQELDDKVHDTFVVVVQAIRRGDLREPERLMGFVRTIVRRQVAAHIDKVVHTRREQMDMDATAKVIDPAGSPEDAAIFRQKSELIREVLEELPPRDREILARFYLLEQDQDQICGDMGLSETQFRLLKSRAKSRFGELGRKKLTHKNLGAVLMRTSAGLTH